MTPPCPISIVIPTLNEAPTLGSTLCNLDRQEGPLEVIVADGGSTDNTVEVAHRYGVTVVDAPKGRAHQMNRGAEAADGEILLFLHADTRLPPSGLVEIRTALSDPSVAGGTFQLQFDDPTPLLSFYAWCTRFPWIRLCFGDRGQFVRRTVFENIGGFPEWPLFEDLEFAARLQDYGTVAFLTSRVTTSARRFREVGPLLQQLHNLYLWVHYLMGTDPHAVAHLYPDHTSPPQ